jgi:hypothetical protein
MDYNRFGCNSTHVLSRVPTTVFLFLGVSRQDAHKMGMIGCGLQLDNTGEFAWGETTISLNLEIPEVCVFLRTRKIPFSTLVENNLVARIPILEMVEYAKRFGDVVEFLRLHAKNKYLRLGSRAFLDPWDLDSRDSFLLRMNDEEFASSFISDPRGRPLLAEVTSRNGRHSPKQVRAVPGLPDPGRGSWI